MKQSANRLDSVIKKAVINGSSGTLTNSVIHGRLAAELALHLEGVRLDKLDVTGVAEV